ncbi:hypothetical protein ACFWIW_14045 [Amycolatopsis sp. NPDC058340]|uniref:hypothetical protein n=1 Tax=Amycolatopsis sp. NPDC058340 TaxID=3346453 RepID=UPI003657ECF6
MTGPEHYAEAESKLQRAVETTLGSDEERYNLASAQVHAMLALAAATVAAGRGHITGMNLTTERAWDTVTGEES